ncbi:MAG: hypothetical protein KKB31_00085 [Nanoarchaeota archaeon]|nr:hypothetical protein [Nanoarchaeota archaeon]
MSKVTHALDKNTYAEGMKKSLIAESEFLGKILKGDVLDIGCGDCRAYDFVKGKVNFYTGIENDKTLKKLMKKPEKELIVRHIRDKLRSM